MTSLYLGLALTLALTLNARFAALRALGSMVAAAALGFMAWSIVLANLDATFAAAPVGSRVPLALNIQAGLITVGAALLLWMVPSQFGRQFAQPAEDVPMRSTRQAYGAITRGLHWASAALIIAAFTIGQFVGILGPQNSLRAEFLDAHLALGGAVFLLTLARMFERLLRPGPPNPTRVHAAHFLLYAALTALCVTGLAMASAPIDLYGLKLPNLPADPTAARLHRGALPLILALLFAAHLGGAVKSIRRMAR